MRLNRIFLLIAGLITIGMLLATCMVYPELSDSIPLHYNFWGEMDRQGDEGSLLWLVGFQVAQFVICTILHYHPEVHNYPIQVTEKNKKALYRENSSLVARLTLLISLMLLIIFICVTTGSQSFPPLILSLFVLFSIVIDAVYYFRRIKQIVKQYH